MNTELETLLIDGLTELGLDVRSSVPLLKLYFGELQLWNPKLGLLEADERGVVVKHILDSAAAVPLFRREIAEYFAGSSGTPDHQIHLADLGSGAGFPGIILAIFLSSEFPLTVHLVEKQQRRCGFLRNIVPILGLGNVVEIHQTAFEDLPRRFDIITSRAFRNMTAGQFDMQKSLLEDHGLILAYKGKVSRLQEEIGELPPGSDIEPLQVPGLDDERSMFIFRR
jgi:16S rRNA (guanine527-N7)-methyltransferase